MTKFGMDRRGRVFLGIVSCIQRFEVCGTLEYLSREVLLNLGYAFDVDLWTLGVLVFEMIAGQMKGKAKAH